jgi:hypothetical protein
MKVERYVCDLCSFGPVSERSKFWKFGFIGSEKTYDLCHACAKVVRKIFDMMPNAALEEICPDEKIDEPGYLRYHCGAIVKENDDI